MKRDLKSLEGARFDVLVVGGGILGACVAWDAALRGLSVALVERGDFGGSTSSNSLKIIHGGLRYLQQLDWRRMRESIRERSTWLTIAPHLVEPLPVVIPTYRRGLQRRSLLRIALTINDAVGWDRNRSLAEDRKLPSGRSLSRAEVLDLVPELERRDLTGGVAFYDGRMYNSERLVLEVVQAARAAGAVAANYVRFDDPLVSGGRLAGARVVDELTGSRLDVQARCVVNCAGNASAAVMARLVGRQAAEPLTYSLAMNVVVPERGHRVAFAIRGLREDPDARLALGGRQFFLVPWRRCLMIGTGHYPWTGEAAEFEHRAEDLARFLEEVNAVWPGRAFDPAEVALVHSGLIPVRSSQTDEIRFLKRHRVIDHSRHGVPNASTIVTGKYTTARLGAEAAVDWVGARLDYALSSSRTGRTPLPGCGTEPVADMLADARRRYGAMAAADVLEHLVRTYGVAYERILDYRRELEDWDQRLVASEPVIKAQWLHGIREEAAVRPDDLVSRRTELGARGLASERLLETADQMLRAESGSRV